MRILRRFKVHGLYLGAGLGGLWLAALLVGFATGPILHPSQAMAATPTALPRLVQAVATGSTDRVATEVQIVTQLNGEPVYLGVITVSTPATVKDNATTAVPFTIPSGVQLEVVCDAAGYIIPLAAGNAASVAAKMIPLDPKEKHFILLRGSTTTGATTASLTADSVSGTTNCKVWQLK